MSRPHTSSSSHWLKNTSCNLSVSSAHTHPSTPLTLVYFVPGRLGCLPRRAVLLQSYLLTMIDSEDGRKKKRGRAGGTDESRPAWTAAGFPRGLWVHPAPEMLFWAARIIKASSDSPLSFFHYLLTFCVARQPCSVTAFDFKCSLLTGMKNAYLAEPRKKCSCGVGVGNYSCVGERERERTRWGDPGS